MSETNLRMTKARRELLAELAEAPSYVASHYPPLRWLLGNDLIDFDGDVYRLTDAGRTALLTARSTEVPSGEKG